jgi:GNAT superfamily N-acetyltransferase
MWLVDGYTDLPSGKLANVVTCLEMRERAPARPEVSWDYALEKLDGTDLHRYRRVFRRIGEAYLWSSRLTMGDDELDAIVRNPAVEVYVLRSAGEDAGILELDFRQAHECELTFFGVADRLVGSGAGRWLMNRAIECAWSNPIRRLWVHTCTLDHPGAVAFYMRSGFVPFKRQIEVLDDPRISGVLPRDAAPGVPLI